MSNLATRCHAPLDKVLLRIFALVLGFGHVGLFMWEPKDYAAAVGGFTTLTGILFIWAVCSIMVFGIGFKPIKWYWQWLFSPYFSIAILLFFTILKL